ncbi:MAG: UPF0179 family protein, partial [Thermoplasmata archaeon]
MLITLIGERQVREGNEFIYHGPLTNCRECRLKSVCFNLEEGRRYRIKGIRGVRHECKIHEDGVQVVEVESVPLSIALSGKSAIEGSTVLLEFPECHEISCKEYSICHPIALNSPTISPSYSIL